MLIISLFILILAVASPGDKNTDKWILLKISRIVFILFLFSGYLVYNTLCIESLSPGIGIYGGVFAVSVMTHIIDIIILLSGSVVTLLTCFIPFYISSKNNRRFRNNQYYQSISREWEKKSQFFSLVISLLYSNRSHIEDNNRRSNLTDNSLNYKPENCDYEIRDLSYIKEYSLLLIFTIIGASLLISAQNLISIYLALELQSFTLYIIAASRIESFKSTSGGLKYFLLGGLSSGFILFGFSILYAYTGTLNLDSIFMIYSGSNNFFIDVCLFFIFGGLLFKVSAAPFHNWAPDVYSDVPTISTTWLIVIAKLSILILILTWVHNINYNFNLNTLSFIYLGVFDIYNFPLTFIFHTQGIYPSNAYFGLWTNLITLSACLSLIIGTLVGLSQGLTKRLLAYSTISHVGFLLAALSINSVVSIDAFLFYLIQYTLTNLNIFFIIIAWGYIFTFYYLDSPYGPKGPEGKWRINHEDRYKTNFKEKSIEWLFSPVPAIAQLKGMHYSDPFLAFSLAISIFSLAGIPPLIGFFAKQQVLLASMQGDYYFLSFLIINTSVIGAAYYLRIIKFIYFYDLVFFSNNNQPWKFIIKDSSRGSRSLGLTKEQNSYFTNQYLLSANNLSLIIALFTNIILFYIFKPYLFVDLIHLISISLFI